MAGITNGIIKSVHLGFDSHGILTAMVTIGQLGGVVQGFGGWNLDAKGYPVGAKIRELLKSIGVDSWDELVGRAIRVGRDKPFGKIESIGHIIEDRWFTWEYNPEV
jgi:hypothetical protein